jgi:hypothetical protein
LDAAGYPHIGYSTTDSVRYAFKDAAGWHAETVINAAAENSPDDTYWFSSVDLALDASMAPHIAYVLNGSHMSWSESSVVYARRDTSGWHRTELSANGCEQCSTGSAAALAVDADNKPHVIYTKLQPLSYLQSDLWYAYWDGDDWQRDAIAGVGLYGGEDLSLSLDADGFPHLGFTQGPEPHVEYGFHDASDWHFETAYPGGQWVGHGVDLALDAGGGASMSFRSYDQGGHHSTALVYAERQGTGWQSTTVVDDHVGAASLALDEQGQPVISYLDTLDLDLKLATRWSGPPPTATVTPTSTATATQTTLPNPSPSSTCTPSPIATPTHTPTVTRTPTAIAHARYLPFILR